MTTVSKTPAAPRLRRHDPEMDMTDHSVHAVTPYSVLSIILLIVLTILFIFPLYWIITGSFKTQQAINARVPVWFPLNPTMNNYERLFQKPAFLWMFNTVLVCAAAMGFTCITASMGGYALAKKRFTGRALLFSIFVCAMALPKQVILIPLLKEMAFLGLHNSLWAVIFPTVGWPFGVFLMKQFSEGIPNEMLEAARIDGDFYLHHHLERLLPPADYAERYESADDFAGHRQTAERAFHRLRPDHGRCGAGLDSDHCDLPAVPEVLYPRHHHGRCQGIRPPQV